LGENEIYPKNKINTQIYVSDNFHNIKNFVQVDHSEKKKFTALKKPPVAGKFFQLAKMIAYIKDVRLPGKNFRKIRPPRASEFELKPDRQFL
jgi:hypothetical protein